MLEINLYKEIEYVAENFRKETHKLLFQTEPLNGDTDFEKREDFLKKIALWRKQHLTKFEKITLYGYMTWYLEISISEFYYPKILDIKTYFLKLLLIDFFKNPEDLFYGEEWNIQGYLDNNCFDLVGKNNYVYSISFQDFHDDLEHYYNHSYARNLAWKESYSQRPDLIANLSAKLDIDYEKFLECIKYFRTFKNCSFIRINKLGEHEGNNTELTEISHYFVITSEKIWLLTLSDFA